jgi:hypothetical protein
MQYVLGLVEPGNVLDSWIPVGAALAGVVALLGAVLTFSRFMRTQETSIDSLRRDLKENQEATRNALSELRVEMNHRFDRREDRDKTYLERREFYAWLDRLRRLHPEFALPSVFDEEG